MAERLCCLRYGLAFLALVGGNVASYAGAPPDDGLGEVTDDLRDFGITGTPVFDLESAMGDTLAAPAVTPIPTRFESPPERVIWNKTPIRVTLPVGAERLVHFPADVRVGLPSPPPPGLRTQSIDGTVYWMASEPFPSTRIQIQELASGQVYLLDLQAEPNARTTPVWILRPRTADTLTADRDTQNPTATPAPATVTFVQLTRHAAQQLYAPRRLVGEGAGIHRVSVKTDPIPLVRGAKVQATPLIAWQGSDRYVTAVRLRNTTPNPVILDPRELRGQWYAATFQHARLFPAGDEADTTCVYLISARPFAEALRGLY